MATADQAVAAQPALILQNVQLPDAVLQEITLLLGLVQVHAVHHAQQLLQAIQEVQEVLPKTIPRTAELQLFHSQAIQAQAQAKTLTLNV